MRRLALVVVSAGALVGSAAAADRPILKARPLVKAPPPAVATISPISFYAGVHVGGGWSTFQATPAIEDVGARGAFGGVQLGANLQSGNFVFGIEGDISAAAMRGHANGTLGGIAAQSEVRHRWFATLGGRAGYAFGRTLPYIKAGGAWTQYHWNFSAGGAVLEEDKSRFGWMLGAGVEQALTDSLSAKIEFNYLDFGRRLETFNATGGLVVPATDVRLYARTVKLGLNYRFVSGH